MLDIMFSSVKCYNRHFNSSVNVVEAFRIAYLALLQLIWDYGPMGGLPQSPLGSDNLALGSDNLVIAR